MHVDVLEIVEDGGTGPICIQCTTEVSSAPSAPATAPAFSIDPRASPASSAGPSAEPASSSSVPDAEPSTATPVQASTWGKARPLGMAAPPAGAAAEQQLAHLLAAKRLREDVLRRQPAREARSAKGEKHGSLVHKEAGGHLCMSIVGHPNATGECVADVNFYDTWRADVSLKVTGFGTGLLPLLALIHEPDLTVDYLPRQPGLPYIEHLQVVHQWAVNDWLYHCFVSPFGPLPGADDVHNFILFDNMDAPADPCLIGYAISPAEGDEIYRGWPVPKVKSWRRKRNYVLGATTIIRPSAQPVLTLEPPCAKLPKCASPGCAFAVHSCLSAGSGRFCCHKCEHNPGKHASGCEMVKFDEGGGAHAWQLPAYGTLELELYVNVQLPIPTFLIPLALVRWIFPRLVRLVYPVLLLLNERFVALPFSQRVREDKDGFYKLVADALKAPERPCNARGREGEAKFVL